MGVGSWEMMVTRRLTDLLELTQFSNQRHPTNGSIHPGCGNHNSLTVSEQSLKLRKDRDEKLRELTNAIGSCLSPPSDFPFKLY
jgi:hypothetical protein